MDIRNIQYELRPRRLLELLDLAIVVVMRRPALFLRFAAPYAIVAVAANTALMALFADPDDGLELNHWLTWLLPYLLYLEMQLLSLPLVLINGRLLFEDRVDAGEIWRDCISLLPRFLIHQTLRRGLLLLAFATPALCLIWILQWWGKSEVAAPFLVMALALIVAAVSGWRMLITNQFAGEVLALERIPTPMLRRRIEALARGMADRSAGLRWIEGLLFLIGLIAVRMSWDFALSGLTLAERYWWLKATVFPLSPPLQLYCFVFFVYHCAVRFLYYIDSRSLREGWDLELALLKGVRETEEAVRR